MKNYSSLNIYQPMLVGKAPTNWQTKIKNKGWLGSKKVDGYWGQLIKEDNEIYILSRTKSRITGQYSDKEEHLPHIKEWAMENLPNGTVIVGEMYYPGGKSNDVTKILGCLPAKAVERQNGGYGKLHFYMHDMLKFDGHDYVLNEDPYQKRYSDLCYHIDLGEKLIPELEVAAVYDSVYCNLEDCTERLLAAGEEGMVIRTEGGLYLPGKRKPDVMFKIKQEENDIDLVITGLLEPEREYTGKELDTWVYWDGDTPVTKAYFNGWKAGFYIGAYDENGELKTIGSVASGMTDILRRECSERPNEFIGQVIELQAMSLNKKDITLRHPRFIRMRPDKAACDCKLQEIFR